MNLNDRLYTSTEVAEILGVSLRSVYRYLEDGKLDAEIKTATGRLRFTKQNILDFLHPGAGSESQTERAAVRQPEEVSAPVRRAAPKAVEPVTDEEDDVDWLSRFKASAEKFRKEQEEAQKVTESPAVESAPRKVEVAPEPEREPVENLSGLVEEVEEKVEQAPSGRSIFYYRSLSGGLKDVAQNIDKVSRRSNVDYAFTLNAGLSLYKPLKDPFSVLHVYIRSQDRDLFEKLLRLVPSDESNSQLCLIFSDEAGVFDTKVELHGLFVVSKDQLRKDIDSFGKNELTEELETA
ncbi:MAG: helix-turn-helix domain-containing protein [Patescibacteria group bacterium]|jgi:excisionase family DNA binding protein